LRCAQAEYQNAWNEITAALSAHAHDVVKSNGAEVNSQEVMPPYLRHEDERFVAL